MHSDTLGDRAGDRTVPARQQSLPVGKSRRPGLALVGILGLAGIAAWGGWQWQATRVDEVRTDVSLAAEIQTVTALGRLEPEGETIALTAPTSTQSGRIEQLSVVEGDRVGAGQVVAILDSRDRLQAALERAEEDVRVARARLEQVRAGAKSGDIAAQSAQIERLAAQWQGEEAAQMATIERLQAQWETERAAQVATIERLQAQGEGDRDAQTATVGRLDAELANAEAEYQRYRQLYESGAISLSLLDSKQLGADVSRQQIVEARANLERIERTAREQVAEARANLERIDGTLSQQLQEARANLERIQRTGVERVDEAAAQLDSIAEVRAVDVQVAQAEVERAIAAVGQARADLERAYVRAPQAGQIVKIHTRPGETIADEGVATLGQTQQMVAIAEVYQNDISQIRVGQPAAIATPVLPDTLRGTVDRVGLQVEPQQVVDEDPAANIDAKVVEVRVRLDPASSQKVAGLTNLQVTVKIQIVR